LAHEIKIAAQDGGNPVVAERTYLYEDDSFEPVAHQEDGRWVHYVNDQIGTPERLLENGGDVACELRRSAWGQTEVLPGAKARTPIRFQGQYADEETGLSYNRWRYFDGEAGSFASCDPIGLNGGLHTYEYAPSPQAWFDPFGLAGTNKR
ncbi:MAG: RHS repeat protein, partial [Deltaproteobacteria bacterium]